MSEQLVLAVSLFAGGVIGILFFGGLWWTIRRGLASAWLPAWFLGSLLLRAAIALVGFYFIAQGDWRRLVAALAGFSLARLFLPGMGRTLPEKREPIAGEERS